MRPGRRLAYALCLAALSLVVFAAFLHLGINHYDRARFLDMVDGTAWRPFVYRTLLPTTVRIVSMGAPERLLQACTELVDAHAVTRRAFEILGLEARGAFQYFVASVLMFSCFMGFGHCAVRFVQRVCDIPDSLSSRLFILTAALLGLPPFFRYTSFPYDPPQLLLFTLALYFVFARRAVPFFITFVACCLNKETAILLVPVFALAFRDDTRSPSRYWTIVAALTLTYVVIKTSLNWAFRANPGSLVEFQLAHNLRLLVTGWTFTQLVVVLCMTWLACFRWTEKPVLLRRAFLMVLVPLVALALFLGFIDEFRGYYEAYPLFLALATHSLIRFDGRFGRTAGEPRNDST